MGEKKVQAFDSFLAAYRMLAWTGYFKLLNKPNKKWKWTFHQAYRVFSFFMTMIFNLQHIIFIVQTGQNLDDVFDSLLIEIPQLYLVAKLVNTNLQTSRIEKINSIICGPMFAPNNIKDEELMLQNKKDLSYLIKILNIGISMCAIFWPATHFVRRYQDENAVVPSYVVFSTETWSKYSLSVAIEVLPLVWIGYGHMALDGLVYAYLAQAEVQLKIIKNNLLHLFDSEGVDKRNTPFRYKDVTDPHYRKRFVYNVQRFDTLAWYMKEMNEVFFNSAILIQFFTSSLSICVLIFRMSTTPVASVPFIFMMAIVIIISAQVFLYCYFGALVQYESQSVVRSLYLSDWSSVSPQFRRQLLVALPRWSREFQPLVSGIIPLSLQTFVSIMKSAYSLYAMLVARQ